MNERSSPSKKSEFDELFDEAEEDSFELENDIPTSIYDTNTKSKDELKNSFSSSTENMNIFNSGDKIIFNSKSNNRTANHRRKESKVQPSINVETNPSGDNKDKYNSEQNYNKDDSELLKLQKMLQEANSKIALLSGELDNLKLNYNDVYNKLTNVNNTLEPLKQKLYKLQDDNKKLIEDNTRLNRVSASMTKKIDYYKNIINKKDEMLNKYRDTIELISNNNTANPSRNKDFVKEDKDVNDSEKEIDNNSDEQESPSKENDGTPEQNESPSKENESTKKQDENSSKENESIKKQDENPNESNKQKDENSSDSTAEDKLDLATRPGIQRVKNTNKYSPLRLDFDDDVYKFIKKGEFMFSKGSTLTSFKNSKGIGKVKSLGNSIKTLGKGIAKGYYNNRIKMLLKYQAIAMFAIPFAGAPGVIATSLACGAKEVYNIKKRGKYLDDLFKKHCRHVRRYFCALNEDGYKLKSLIKTTDDLISYCKLLISKYPDRFFPEEIEDLKTFVRFANVWERADYLFCF